MPGWRQRIPTTASGGLHHQSGGTMDDIRDSCLTPFDNPLVPEPLELLGDLVLMQLFLGNAAAVAVGREVHGQPKKDGRPRLEVRDDLWVGTVERNGIDVITATMAYKQQRSDLGALTAHADFRNNINLKIVPNVDGTHALRQLTSRVLQDVRVHECWRGAATMELRANAQAPVYRLPVRDVVEGFYWRVSFVLPFGEVIHDYLSPREAPHA
jgi:acetoacetate decarboxylase